ncbi:ABC transporter permease [Methylovirgula sp. 4M-Z18]|uniref:ABC transporter permease n=1 Tax=Methylovirgula sp. 4M-Z18 TaxID=2293567 RepID=UPI000E2FDFB6|nr:ABC transporter permease [Methylovirgula sp. 4M-Z18]RFB81279.1 ABC transporter permease [Methylovirgula sp. 4M-Z18]
MSSFLARRLISFAVTLLIASVLVFLALQVLPGNAAQVIMGPDASPDAVAALAHKLHLDEPLPTRYAAWISGLLRGDFGESSAYGTPAFDLIAQRLGVSLPLALAAMTLATGLALAFGMFAATKHNTLIDAGVIALSQIGLSVPSFWAAILLILLFAVHLHWLAAGGFPGWDGGLWQAAKALALPVVSLSLAQAAILTRVTRSALLDVLREDFIRTARAKGLTRNAALWRHGLRNALVPIITVMGLQFANLLASAIVTENVFQLPGLGRLLFQSIANRDLVVVQDCVMLLVGSVVAINFLVDIASALIDPRLKAQAR